MEKRIRIRPSQEAMDHVTYLAQRAAAEDGWMQPTPEDHTEELYEDFIQAHRSGWENSTHFQAYYGDKLSNLCDREEMRWPPLDTEVRYYALYPPILDLFWDTWEEEVELHNAWCKSRQKKGKT